VGANTRDNDGAFTIGSLSFEDTALGGCRFMNPKPQPCRIADPKIKSAIAKVRNDLDYSGSTDTSVQGMQTFGMGRWYAETINQHQTYITIQAGLPQFNSLTNFLSGFYDPGQASLVNSGTLLDDMVISLGRIVGTITVWSLAPLWGIGAFAFSTGRKILADVQGRPLSKFYWVKPSMDLYWGTVQNIVNALVVDLQQQGGLGNKDLKRNDDGSTGLSSEANDSEMMRALGRTLPDIFLNKSTGGLDVRAVACRYERLAVAHQDMIDRLTQTEDVPTWEDVARGLLNFYDKYTPSSGILNEINPVSMLAPAASKSIGHFLDEYRKSSSGTGKHLVDQLSDLSETKQPEEKTGDNNTGGQTIDQQTSSFTTSDNSKLSTSVMEHWLGSSNMWSGVMRDGSQFVSFAVDYDRHVGESFSNHSKPSDLQEKMNSKARAGREALFSVANGNVGDGLIASTVQEMFGLVGKFLAGAADSVGMSGLAMLGGKAQVDIPEFWDSSSVDLPQMTYTIPLRSWSGHPVALLQNIYLPLAMWVALTGARATGRSSYSSPYYVKCWKKGYAQTQHGLVTQLQITRGAGNLGWNKAGQPIAVDLHVTITDMSKMLYIPMSADLSKKDMMSEALVGLPVTMFDEDSTFSDLMATWAALGLNDQYYPTNKWRLRREKRKMDFNTFFTMNHLMTSFRDTGPGSFISLFHRQNRAGSL
jgi:hypothetical protein